MWYKYYTGTDNVACDHSVHAGWPESESSPQSSPKLSPTLLQSSSELAVSALFSQLLHLQASVHGMFVLKHEHRHYVRPVWQLQDTSSSNSAGAGC